MLIGGTQGLLARLSAFVDRWIIDGVLVRGASGATWGVGLRCCGFFQVGNLQAYAFLFGLGVVGLIYFTRFPLMLLFSSSSARSSPRSRSCSARRRGETALLAPRR